MSDLISRLSELRSQYSCFDENERDAYHALSEAIKALQAQTTLDDVSNAYENGYQQGKFEAQQWISCSERLPEDEVLCCDVHQNLMFGYVFTSEKSNTGYSAESEHEYMYDCVAWMPLPSPYTEDKNG